MPSKCLRYENNVSEIVVVNNDTCNAKLFNKNITIRCDRFVYESDKITITQDVRKFNLKNDFFFLSYKMQIYSSLT